MATQTALIRAGDATAARETQIGKNRELPGQIPLLAGISREALRALAAAARLVYHQEQYLLLKDGEKGDAVYFLLSLEAIGVSAVVLHSQNLRERYESFRADE